MSDLQPQESLESNPWNPFITTPRDLKRTEQLAKKNSVIAGVLTLFFIPAGMIYLNRGVNSLKILAYTLVLATTFTVLTSETEEQAFQTGRKIGFVANIAVIVENINTINKARKRRKTEIE